MFQEEQFYEGKVFLKSYRDAILCLKETAEFHALKSKEEQIAKRLVQAKDRQDVDIKDGRVVPGLNYAQSREVKLFQFSNQIFQKYLSGFEQYSGAYKGFQQIVNDALTKIKAEK